MTDNFFRALKVVALLMIALASLIYVSQYRRSVSQAFPARNFSVDGKADVDVVPDIATFTVSAVSEGGQDVSAVQLANTEKMNKVNAFLKEQGVDAKDLKTVDYNLSPRYSNTQCFEGVCPQSTIIGYTLNQTLQVKVRDTAKLGDLLSGVVGNGANNVSTVQFTVDDDTKAKDKARAEAIAEAQKKARSIAKAGGFRLGKLITLYENSNPGPVYGYGMGGMMSESSVKVSQPPTIEPGTQSTEVQVTLTYEIKK